MVIGYGYCLLVKVIGYELVMYIGYVYWSCIYVMVIGYWLLVIGYWLLVMIVVYDYWLRY